MPESPLSEQLNALAQILQSSQKGGRDPQRIIECAADFCSIVEGHAELGRRTATEDVLVKSAGNQLLRWINSVSGAVAWLRFANRVGAQPGDVERLELGVSGIVAAIDSGEEFDQRDITAMQSALSRLAGTGVGLDGDCNSSDGAKKMRGRPRRSDPDAARILNAWDSGQHQTYEECARALNLFTQDQVPNQKRVIRVVNRELQKQRRAKKRASTKTPD
jgi:hypothetical protein